MPHKRSPKKLEERIAKQYVYKHSVNKRRNNDPNEMTEKVYTGTSDDINGHVLAKLGEIQQKSPNLKLDREVIPDYPQGLVFSDSHGEGYFDVHF
jgi:hypothetical protein